MTIFPFDLIIHRWLRIPYALNIHHDRRPKKPVATVVLLHGIGNSGASWDDVIKKLPKNIRVITVDLLGFGNSPKPTWATYSVTTQARSFIATYIKLGLRGKVILVGHSMGSLVSIEIAKRYPLLVQSLILCSPPFYISSQDSKRLTSDKVLRDIYQIIEKRPDQFVQVSALAMKYGIINKGFNVTDTNITSYVSALRTSIIHQSSLADAIRLRLPIRVIHGIFDPLVIPGHITTLKNANDNVSVKQVVAGHEVTGMIASSVVKEISSVINRDTKTPN
jgi:cis-3-alkyl-4-acyloxetan-2-one decarboxylase